MQYALRTPRVMITRSLRAQSLQEGNLSRVEDDGTSSAYVHRRNQHGDRGDWSPKFLIHGTHLYTGPPKISQ
jgi:hypothetical protein